MERYKGGLIRKITDDMFKWEVTYGTFAGDPTQKALSRAHARELLTAWVDTYRPSGGYVVDARQSPR